MLAGLDRKGFSRAFKATTGATPYVFLTRCRMERAKALLEAGQPVTEVALSVGYANPSKFAAAFRAETGALPRIWRARKLSFV